MLGPTRAATTLPLFLPQSPPDKATGLIHDATLLTQVPGQGLPRTRSGGRTLGSRAFRAATEAALGGTDAKGVWMRKDAYEALEAAQVLFLRKFGTAMRSHPGCAAAMIEMLTRLAGGLASQMRRLEEAEHFQQFSPPIALGFVAAEAAAAPSTWDPQIDGKRDGLSVACNYAAMATPVTSAQVAKAWMRSDRRLAAVSWSRRRGKALATWSWMERKR